MVIPRTVFKEVELLAFNEVLKAITFFYRDAEDAVYGEDGKRFDGNRIKVQFPRGNPKARDSSSRGSSSYTQGRGRNQPISRTDYRILVSGLPPSGSWQDLKDHMREAGEVVYADVYKDGTAVCEFKKYDDMKWALKNLDDTKFKSHEVFTIFSLFIHINLSKPQQLSICIGIIV